MEIIRKIKTSPLQTTWSEIRQIVLKIKYFFKEIAKDTSFSLNSFDKSDKN